MNKPIDPFDSSCPNLETLRVNPVPPPVSNLDFLQEIANEDVAGLIKAQQSYGDSWKRRGGAGAFFMLARKWDRLENAMTAKNGLTAYDIFERIIADMRAEGIIDDVRDLRRYFLLVESEMRARGVIHGTHRDNVAEDPLAKGVTNVVRGLEGC